MDAFDRPYKDREKSAQCAWMGVPQVEGRMTKN